MDLFLNTFKSSTLFSEFYLLLWYALYTTVTLIHNNKYIHGKWIVINVLWEIQKKIVGSTPEPSLIKGLIVKLDAKDYSRRIWILSLGRLISVHVYNNLM